MPNLLTVSTIYLYLQMAGDMTTFLMLSSSKSDWPFKDKSMDLMMCFGIGLTQALCSRRLMLFWRSLELWPSMVMAIHVLYIQAAVLWNPPVINCSLHLQPSTRGRGMKPPPPIFEIHSIVLLYVRYLHVTVTAWYKLTCTTFICMTVYVYIQRVEHQQLHIS